MPKFSGLQCTCLLSSFSLIMLVWLSAAAEAQAPANAESSAAKTVSTADATSNFFERLADYYKTDWSPLPLTAGSVASAPERRILASPLDSPPFPSSDWSYGGSPEIGAPNPTGTPLMTALYGAEGAAKRRTQIYGWIEPGLNFSTSSTSNAPAGYDLYPNRLELDQAVAYVERLPDTVQTRHFDYGYHATAWYGTDYRYTVQKGNPERSVIEIQPAVRF